MKIEKEYEEIGSHSLFRKTFALIIKPAYIQCEVSLHVDYRIGYCIMSVADCLS
jgi:hypothetical protein